jgi:hypothetical protein
MKKVLTSILLVVLLACPAFAGWEIKAKFAESPASADRQEVLAAKPSEKPEPPKMKTVTMILDGPRIKWTSDDEPDNFVVLDLEKQSYIFGFASEEPAGGASQKASAKPQKVAIVGTLDEFLNLIGQFMEMMKSMEQMMGWQTPNEPKVTRETSATKTDFIVKPGLPDKDIAGCETNGVTIIVMETQVSQPAGTKKTDLTASTKGSGDLFLCPDIDTAYLIPYIEAIQKKLKDWAKKWEDTFRQTMGGEESSEGGANLMAAPFAVEKYEDVMATWKTLKGFPFLAVDTTPGKTAPSGRYEVISYRSRDIAPSEFAVPKGYKIQKMEEAIRQMMSGMMGGMDR